MKQRKFAFRLTEKQYLMLKTQAKKAGMTMTDFIVASVTGKEIVVIDGVTELHKQLKAIGHNLNQLTAKANAGVYHTVWLDETKAELAKSNELFASLCSLQTGGATDGNC